MDIQQAMSVLNIQGHINTQDIKKAFHQMSNTAHPDKGGSNESMSLVNQAYKLLKSSVDKLPKHNETQPLSRHTIVIEGQEKSLDPKIKLKVVNYGFKSGFKSIVPLLESWLGNAGLASLHKEAIHIFNTNSTGQAKYKGAEIYIHDHFNPSRPFATVWFRGCEISLFLI